LSNPGIAAARWGTGAPERIEKWDGCYGVEADTPVPGTQSLRLTSGPGGVTFGVQSYAYSAPPDKSYTLSLYLKSLDPDMQASLSVGDKSTSVPVGPEWKRHVFTTAPSKGHWASGRMVVTFGLGKPGTLWVAAPQLESGDQATAYRLADADRPAAPGAKAPAEPPLPANALPLPTAVCAKTAEPPKLDGKLDDACYQSASRLTGFRDINSGELAGEQTECWVLRDGEALYVAFRCLQTQPGPAKAQVTRRDGAVFGEESVELFLQPNPASGEYIHLATNALGRQFDEIGFDTAWDADWQVATERQDNAWTAELRIPFAALPIGPDAPERWRMNLCRNAAHGTQKLNSAWSCTYGGFHRPSRFGNLDGMSRADLARFGWRLADLGLSSEANQVVLRGKVAAWPAGWKEARVSAKAQPKQGPAVRETCTVALDGRAAQPVPFTLYFAAPEALGPGPISVEILLYGPRGGPRLHQEARSFSLGQPGVQEARLSAVFERSYYTTEPTARVRVSWAGAAGASLALNAKSAAGQPIALTLAPAGRPLAHGENFLNCDIAALPPGEYSVGLTAGEGDQAAQAVVAYGLTKLAPAKTEVKMDRFRRCLLVNGEPFLVYAQGIHGYKGGWWSEDIAAHGFNSVVAGFPTSASDEELAKNVGAMRSYLDECLTHNLRVILWMSLPQGPYPPMRDAVIRNMRALRDHPAIVCWYLVDEPEGWWESSEGGKREGDLRDLLLAAKAADPYRPSHINWYAWTTGKGGYGGLEATDIGSLDRYPIGRGDHAMKTIADVAAQMNADCRPRSQPTAFWCQMYGYDDAIREPTPAEEACMTYLCVIEGMRLVYYFIYKPMSPDLWASMTPLGQELKTLQPLLCDADARELSVATTGETVRYALWIVRNPAWQAKDGLLLIAANAGYEPVTATLDLASQARGRAANATVLFEDRSVSLKGGRLTDTFAPCARHVYVLR
jgi:hypothetical protein